MFDNKDKQNNFKMTELGPLPEDWEVLRLGEVNAYQKKTINPSDFPEEIFEYYSIPAYQEGKEPIFEKGKNIRSQKFLLKKGIVLFGKLNPRVEKVWFVESGSNYRLIGSTEWIPIEASERVDPVFLYYLMWSEYVMPKAKKMVSGSTPSRQRIDLQKFFRIKIPLPSLPEQKAIARVLKTIQDAIEATERVIAAAKELKKSLMRHLFTYGPVPVSEASCLRLKQTEIGPIPEDWEVVRLGILAKIVRGASPRPKGDPKYFSKTPTPIHWIKISDLSKYKVGKFITNSDDYLTEEGKRKSRFLPKGTFIVTNSGTIGIPAFLGIDGCIHDGFLAFLDIKKEQLYADYLYYWFYTIKPYLEKITPKGTQANLNTNIAKNLKIPLPPLSVQQKIAQILKAVDDKIEAEKKKKEALQTFFKTMLHHLMTGKIRVKISEE